MFNVRDLKGWYTIAVRDLKGWYFVSALVWRARPDPCRRRGVTQGLLVGLAHSGHRDRSDVPNQLRESECPEP
jgi:hypothetical protein